jgi:hypothetical protein
VIADARFRKWLNHKPRPVYIICDETRIEAPNSDRGWAEVAESIQTMAPGKVQCFDANGRLLRAKAFEFFFPNGDDTGSGGKPGDSELVLMSRLLADAYDRGNKSAEPLLNNAMAFTERLSVRLAKTEAECDKLRGQVARLQHEIAVLRSEPVVESDGVTEILGHVAQAALAAQNSSAEQRPNGKRAKS